MYNINKRIFISIDKQRAPFWLYLRSRKRHHECNVS